MSDRVLLIWDENRHPFILGGCLFLLVEGFLKKTELNAKHVDLAIIGRFTEGELKGKAFDILGSPQSATTPLFKALLSIQGCNSIILSQTKRDLEKHIKESNDLAIIWPSLNALEPSEYLIGTGLVCSHYHQLGHAIPDIRLNTDLQKQAEILIAKLCNDKPIISLHLKNNPNVIGESNADMPVWAEFLASCQDQATFIITGNEAVSKEIEQLENVYITQNQGSSLALDLALISKSNGFMGTSSALCQMAIFSQMPYVIFKNPDHHVEEMSRDLGDGDHFPFARPNQKLLREYETKAGLKNALQFILSNP